MGKPKSSVSSLPPEFKWTPLSQFEWKRQVKKNGKVVSEQVIGQYIPGMSYNCSRQPVHDALREQCAKWLDEGKIEIINLKPGEYFEIHTVEE